MVHSPKWLRFYNGSPEQVATWDGVKTANEMPWYLALEISFIVIVLSALVIFVGAWLKGSGWINKSNTYVKGQVYVRTKLQNIVFRTIVLSVSLFFIFSFVMESLWDITDNVAFPDTGDINVVGDAILDYVVSPAAWYFQCFMTSSLLGFMLFFKKYKAALILWPMAIVGATSVFMSMESTLGLGDDSSFWGFGFQRSLIEHLLILVFPLFIIVSQRYSYTISNALKAASYMFFLQFGIYILYTIGSLSNSQGTISMRWAGEFRTIAEFIGYDVTWLAAHFHLFMWGMLVPFGIACMILIVFIRQFFYHFGNTDAKVKKESNIFIYLWNIFVFKITHMWKQWWNEIKIFEVSEFTNGRFIRFFTRAEKQEKTKYVLFGIQVKENQIPDDNNYKISLINKKDVVKPKKNISK